MYSQFMPTDTYQEEIKGVSGRWYISDRKITGEKGTPIYSGTLKNVQTKIEKYGRISNPDLPFDFPNGKNFSKASYSLFDVQVVIHNLLEEIECSCPLHFKPNIYLTILADNKQKLDIAVRKLRLPLEERVNGKPKSF